MSRTTKQDRKTPVERPLPARKAPIAQEFTPRVMVVDSPRHTQHYRTTLEFLVSPDAYVRVCNRTQRDCNHIFDGLTRFGDAGCTRCEARGWCMAWVADGVYGDETYDYARLSEKRWLDEMNERLVLVLLADVR